MIIQILFIIESSNIAFRLKTQMPMQSFNCKAYQQTHDMSVSFIRKIANHLVNQQQFRDINRTQQKWKPILNGGMKTMIP